MSEPSLWIPVYVALGSNLDDPVAQVRAAFAALERLPRCRLIARSRLYRTAPLGPQNQPDFVNAAAGLLTQLNPHELLRNLKDVEIDLGRVQPAVRWGPRHIDLDLIAYGDVRVQDEHLTVPHPGAATRNFVLYPLRDIAPAAVIPGVGVVGALAARIGPAGLTLLAEPEI